MTRCTPGDLRDVAIDGARRLAVPAMSPASRGQWPRPRPDPVRLYRDAPLLLIGEGTSEIQKMVIGKKVLERNKI